jgi:ubiquinone/menaquinone biosynthesis C-methylase UbiE
MLLTMNNEAQAKPERLMQMAWSFAPPLMIAAGVKNKLFESLADGPKSVSELADATGASPRGLTELTNALAGLELLARDEKGRLQLTRESEAFLLPGRPGYLGGFFSHITGQVLNSWLALPDIVRNGRPAMAVNQEQTGSAFFQELVEGLFDSNYPAARVLGQALKVESASEPVRVLDLAAGSGVWSIALAHLSPRVTATAVDWPGVLDVTQHVVARNGLQGRYEFISGDLLEVDFGTGYDIATLGHILHSEGERRSRHLLQKVRGALKPGGRIAIAEFLVNKDRSGPMNALIFALNMLVHTEAGSTYSFEEISEWLKEAEFTDVESVPAPAPSPLIVARRA